MYFFCSFIGENKLTYLLTYLHLKISFFLKHIPIHFDINRSIVIRPVKWNLLNFPNIEINKPLLDTIISKVINV